MSGQYQRTKARRVFSAEIEDANHFFKEEDREKAPEYLLLPTGVRAHRVLIGGTVTEKADVSSDSSTPYIRTKISDSTGSPGFLTYTGQYQPDAIDVIRDINPPEYVLICGKTDSIPVDDGEDTISTVTPEKVSIVDRETVDRWSVETAKHTYERIVSDTQYQERAQKQYGGVPQELDKQMLSALEDIESRRS